MHFVISIVLGMLPEIFFFTLAIIYTRNKKENRIKLFLLIAISYYICIIATKYKTINYFLFIIMGFLVQKILYKDTSKIDIFVFSIIVSYVTLNASIILLCKSDYSNYWQLFFINRIILIIPFLFKNKLNKMYTEYKKLWNRSYDEIKIFKSITVRNSSLIILNLLIFSINFICLFIAGIAGGD